MRPSGSRANRDGQVHRRSEPSQHVDKRVRTEQVDPPTEEIADAWLGYTEYLGCVSLFETAGSDELLNLDHQGNKKRGRESLFYGDAGSSSVLMNSGCFALLPIRHACKLPRCY